ncbi:MAG: threonylcarbamoyl-AMP synthase [Candidatus Aureabacteria bacterium]|nr:threonylcarbamoyl-AMP synthase [Candidatus Auribacterota bacterium]
MKIYIANRPEETATAVLEAAKVVKAGGIIAFPTETVYGLGADAENPDAVDRLYEIKKRNRDKPFTNLIASAGQMDKTCVVSGEAAKIIKEFWPGPVTLIFKSSRGKKGYRVPSNIIALSLLRKCGKALVAPSANPSGAGNPKDAATVKSYFEKDIDLLIDGGPADLGIESTVIDFSSAKPSILRTGAVSAREIREKTGVGLDIASEQ